VTSPQRDESGLEQIRRWMTETGSYGMWANLGMRVVDAGPGEATIAASPTAEQHGQQSTRGAFLHGGVLATVADAAMAAAARTLCGPGEGVATAQLQVEYLRPAAPGPLRAHGEVRHRGRSIFRCRAVITQGEVTVGEASAVVSLLLRKEEA